MAEKLSIFCAKSFWKIYTSAKHVSFLLGAATRIEFIYLGGKLFLRYNILIDSSLSILRKLDPKEFHGLREQYFLMKTNVDDINRES